MVSEPNWDGLKCFICIARHKSLTAASIELGVSVPTLGRRMDSLENSLGLKLLKRGPDGIKVTQNGEHILVAAKPGAHHFQQISRVAHGLKTARQSITVRISSTEPMIAEVLAPNLPSLLNANKNIGIELEASTGISNLNIGEADIAIRLVKPMGDTLIARKLSVISMGLYCSSKYLGNRKPSDLNFKDEAWLAYDRLYGPIAENVWVQTMGLEKAVILRSGSVKALLNATRAGAGISLLPDFMTRGLGLIQLPGTSLPKRAPWIVFHRDTRNHNEMKKVRQWIIQTCQKSF